MAEVGRLAMEADIETRDLLLSTAEKLFADYGGKEVVNRSEAGTWPQELWDAAELQGLVRAALPDNCGGAGIGLPDALFLGRAFGRHSVPLPLGETIIAGWLLAQVGLSVPNGPLGFGPTEPRPSISLERLPGGGWALNGSLRNVPWGMWLHRLVVVVSTDRGAMLATVDPAIANSVAHANNLAGEQRSHFKFNDVLIPEDDVRVLPTDFADDIALVLGATLRAQQMAGALGKARDLAIKYAGERVQFGQPLSKLAAVQQNLAILASHAAAANAAADMSIDALARWPRDPSMSVGMAKIRNGEAVPFVAGLSHQTHGAIGFTYEHTLHQSTRRLWSWRDEFGNEAYWAKRIGSEIMAAGEEQLWDLNTKAAGL